MKNPPGQQSHAELRDVGHSLWASHAKLRRVGSHGRTGSLGQTLGQFGADGNPQAFLKAFCGCGKRRDFGATIETEPEEGTSRGGNSFEAADVGDPQRWRQQDGLTRTLYESGSAHSRRLG